MPEVLGDAACVMDSFDPDAWAGEALRLARLPPDERAALSARGRERAALFTWQKCAAATLAAYRECAAVPL